MFCKDCPKIHAAVVVPDVACKSKCGVLISGWHTFCKKCSAKLKQCEECGKKV